MPTLKEITSGIASLLGDKVPEREAPVYKTLQTPLLSASSGSGGVRSKLTPDQLDYPDNRISARLSDDPNDVLSHENQTAELKKYSNILGYRPDVRQPGKLETLPIGWSEEEKKVNRLNSLNIDQLRQGAEAIAAAKAMGYKLPEKETSPQFLAALALREGRGDYGNNVVLPQYASEFFKNKKSLEAYNKMLDAGYNVNQATFVANILQKNSDARRLGIPFTMAWNGAGLYKMSDGKIGGGKYYAKNFNLFEEAALHPKNSSLYHFIKGSLMPDSKPNNKANGGSVTMPENYRSGGRVRMI